MRPGAVKRSESGLLHPLLNEPLSAHNEEEKNSEFTGKKEKKFYHCSPDYPHGAVNLLCGVSGHRPVQDELYQLGRNLAVQ